MRIARGFSRGLALGLAVLIAYGLPERILKPLDGYRLRNSHLGGD